MQNYRFKLITLHIVNLCSTVQWLIDFPDFIQLCLTNNLMLSLNAIELLGAVWVIISVIRTSHTFRNFLRNFWVWPVTLSNHMKWDRKLRKLDFKGKSINFEPKGKNVIILGLHVIIIGSIIYFFIKIWLNSLDLISEEKLITFGKSVSTNVFLFYMSPNLRQNHT